MASAKVDLTLSNKGKHNVGLYVLRIVLICRRLLADMVGTSAAGVVTLPAGAAEADMI